MADSVFSAESILAAAAEASRFGSSPETLENAKKTVAWLTHAKALIEDAMNSGTEPEGVFDLSGETESFRDFLFDTLESGEIRIMIDQGAVKLEETGVPSLWRMQEGGRDKAVLGFIPKCVIEAAQGGADRITRPADKPEGLFAGDATLSQIEAAAESTDLTKLNPDAVPLSVVFSNQPLSQADKDYIGTVLGTGRLEIQMQSFARSTISQTAVKGVWRSRILNKAGQQLLDQAVVCLLPPEVPSTAESLPEAVRKLSDMIGWLEKDIAREAA